MAPGLHEFLFRLKALANKRRLDRDLAEELEFHQAMMREKKQREGAAAGQAEAAARVEFGNAARWHERLRELWQFHRLETLLRDVSFSARLLRKSPGFTAVALLTLALGVGATTSVFSLINGLLLRPLPVPRADELAVLRYERTDDERASYSFCAPMVRALEKRTDFAQMMAVFGTKLQVRNGQGNEEVHGALVSGKYFDVLKTAPLLGRYLTAEDDREGGGANGFGVVLSYRFWRSWFNGAPNVVGRRLTIANSSFTVVGVMPKGFIGTDPTARPEIYLPLGAEPVVDAPYSNIASGFHSWWLQLIARRNAGVSLEQVNAALLASSNSLLDESVPDAEWVKDARAHHFRFVAEPGSAGFAYVRMMFRKPLVAVFALCGAMLLLACLNLASLLMARGAARERELATRLAIGATRRRLVQQLLVESLLIAVLGTGAGLAVSPVVSHSLAALLTRSGGTLEVDTGLDARVLLFAGAVMVLATLLIGLIPALQATSGSLNEHLKDGAQAVASHERRRVLPRLLMSLEVALALMLVVGAGLLGSSLVRLYRTGLGFDAKGLVHIGLSMNKQALDGAALTRWYQSYGESLAQQPGVKGVSYESMTPLGGSVWTDGFHSALSKGDRELHMNGVAPEYFRTMRIPMVEGRDFRWGDTPDSGNKIILNQSAARLLFPGENAVGRQVQGWKNKQYEVVAVVGDVKYASIREAAPAGGYVAVTQDTGKKPSYTAVVRLDGSVGGSAEALAAAARQLAGRMAPDIPAPVMTTMSSDLDASISSERMMAMLSVFFAGCALFVTAIGLYGTLAYATARRTNEIGIRMALGAQRTQVVGMVFRENVWIALLGAGAGLGLALAGSRALASFLYGTSTRDPGVLIGSVVALVAVASVASLIPAIRAARIEPIRAIRYE